MKFHFDSLPSLAVPALFELNERLDEPTGTVLRFCSRRCRDRFREKHPKFRGNSGTDTLFVPGDCPVCGQRLTDDLFMPAPVPRGAELSRETLEYLNDIWGPGFVSVHDIDVLLAESLLENAQDDVAENEHLCDKEAYNAYAVVHGLPEWHQTTPEMFQKHKDQTKR